MLGSSQFPGLKPREPEPNPFISTNKDLKKAFTEAKQILILIPNNPKLDHIASALGLYLSLSKTEKSVTIACPTPMKVEFNRLVGVDKISTNIGNRNLVISFPYEKDSIEKVSYNIDNSNFNLVIQPKQGFPNLQSDKVSYSYSGAEADLVFVIGAQKLENLGTFFEKERKLFDTATIVNIDYASTNTRFAQINIVWNEYSSCAEAIIELLEILGFGLSEDIATNLLSGLNEATQNFQRFNVKPKAFETASKLMQAGAKRSPGMGSSPSQSRSPMMPRFMGQMPGYPQSPMSQPQPPMPRMQPQPQPQPQTQPSTPQVQQNPTQTEPQTLPTPQTGEIPLGQPQQQQAPVVNSPNKDWLKPKIYKGSSKI